MCLLSKLACQPSPQQPPLYAHARDCRSAWREIGASSEVLSWIEEGVLIQWKHGLPPGAFHLGETQLGPEEARGWEMLKSHYLLTGAIKPATCQKYASRAFLIPKKDGGYRLIVDVRHLNSFCHPLKCRYETLKVLSRLASQGSWMISFDIQDAFHALSIHPSHRQYFTFQLAGEAFQCAALPFGWVNSPYIFTKFMRPFVQHLRHPSPLSSQSSAQRPRKTGPLHQRHSGTSHLPYLDDFLVLTKTQQEAQEAAEFIKAELHRLGLRWKDSKCHWTPTQQLQHLGLGLDTARGLFMVTPQRMARLQKTAKDLLCKAAASARHIFAKQLAQFCGLANSVQLAVLPARLYLRELFNCLSTRTSWSSTVRLSHQALRDLQWWRTMPSRHNGRAIWIPPTTATLHTDASGFGWGAALDGTVPAQRFLAA